MSKAATSFAAFLGRIPKPVLFGAAILIQIALLAAMVFDRAGILREGKGTNPSKLVDALYDAGLAALARKSGPGGAP